MAWRALGVVLLAAAALAGASVTPVGCLGNSGGAGPGLVRVGDVRCETGVAVDPDGGLWVSGGDRLNRLALSGRLMAGFPLPAGVRANGRTFALTGGALFCLGERQRRAVVLRKVLRGETPVEVLPTVLPARVPEWWPACLCAEPVAGKLLLACQVRDKPGAIGLFSVDPASGELTSRAELPGRLPSGLAWDAARGVLYLGGQFPEGWAITALRADGTRAPGDWPQPTTKTPAIPTSFVGRVSLAGGALWDTAHYGFVARLDPAAQVDPGRVIEWHHELDTVTQIAALPGSGRCDALLLGTSMADAVYAGVWDRGERELRLVRRLGALPAIASLSLSADGWVTVGTARGTLWWRFDDGGDAPPRKVDMHVATTAGWFRGEELLACGAAYQLDDARGREWRPMVFPRRTGDRNEARRQDPIPGLPTPAGWVVVPTPGRQEAAVYASDTAGRKLWRGKMSLGNLQIDPRSWQTVAIEGVELSAPQELAPAGDGRLVLVDGARVLLLEPRGAALGLTWTVSTDLGRRLHVASDGRALLVSDTERHRVLWYDLASRTLVAQCGATDRAGDDEQRLDQPAQVAVSGTRAVVADQGNQRVLRLVLEP